MHAKRSKSRMLGLLGSALMLASCAATSPVTPPAPEVQIPSPPVKLAPEHSRTFSPKAADFSELVRVYFEKVQLLTTSAQPK